MKMTKGRCNVLPLLILFILPISTTGQEISAIKVIKTELSTDCAIDVDCDKFFRQFAFSLDTFYINDQQNQDEMRKHIKNAARVSDKWNVDTRAKMYVYYTSGKTDSLCLGYTTIFSFNGAAMQLKDRKLIKMIDTMTNRNIVH